MNTIMSDEHQSGTKKKEENFQFSDFYYDKGERSDETSRKM